MQQIRRFYGCAPLVQPGLTLSTQPYVRALATEQTTKASNAAGSEEQKNNSQAVPAAAKPLLKALQQGLPVFIAEFQISEQEVLRRFEAYQQQRCSWMHAHGILNKCMTATSSNSTSLRSRGSFYDTRSSSSSSGSSGKPLYPGGYSALAPGAGQSPRSRLGLWPVHLPFWGFDVVISAEAKGHIGFLAPGGKEMVWKEMHDWLRVSDHQAYSHRNPIMQAYASYQSTREIGEGAKSNSLPHADPTEGSRPTTNPTTGAQAESGKPGSNHESTGSTNGPATNHDRSAAGTSADTSSPGAGTDTRHPGSGTASGAGSAAAASSGTDAQSSTGTSRGVHSDSRTGQTDTGSSTAPLIRLLSMDEATSGTSQGSPAAAEGAAMQPLEMKQGVAWQLVYRALVQRHVQQAEAIVRAQTGAAYVRDIHVRLTVHERRPRVVYLPAYIARYAFGSRHLRGTAGNAEPQLFDAIIGGTMDGRIVAARHLSMVKVVTTAMASVVGLGILTKHAAIAAGLASSNAAWAAEIIMLSTLVGNFAGVWARSLAQSDRDRITARMIAADNVFHQEYTNRETRTAASAAAAAKAAEESGETAADTAEKDQLSDEYMQWLWMDADWRRWGEDEPWNWNPDVQQQAADRIWLQQARRRIERQRFVQRLRNAKERRLRDGESEDRRERMFGASHRRESHHFTEDHGMGAGRNAAERFPSRRRDFLGYYKLLGLDLEGEINTDNIKVAFKSTAMQLHPDRFINDTPEAQKSANVRFQKLQIAYDVLRDPDKRSQYDRGTLTLH